MTGSIKLLPEQTKRLLSKEASLCCMNIGVGLTFLRKSNFAEMGFAYQAFFSLSIGLERLMKLILVYEYYFRNNVMPSQQILKGFGHDLKKLFDEVEKISTTYSANQQFEKIRQKNICVAILNNLSDFAKYNRYSHLDQLTGINSNDDPLVRWESEVNAPIAKRHYRASPKDIQLQNLAKAMDVEGSVIIRHTSATDQNLHSLEAFTKESVSIEIKRKYSMYYAYYIVHALCELQLKQNYQSRTDIDLHEFFKTFRVELSYALNRKSWNPYSPFKF